MFPVQNQAKYRGDLALPTRDKNSRNASATVTEIVGSMSRVVLSHKPTLFAKPNAHQVR